MAIEQVKELSKLIKKGKYNSYIIIFSDNICLGKGGAYSFVAAGTEHIICRNNCFRIGDEDAYVLFQSSYLRLKYISKLLDNSTIFEMTNEGIAIYTQNAEYLIGATKTNRDNVLLYEKEVNYEIQ